jgi:mannan endo-1,4-beta-mannosidase
MASQQTAPSIGNGVSVQPSYYQNGDVGFGWDLMRQHHKIRTVRIEIEPNMATQARGWIQQACGNGYDVIATYHKFSVLGSDSVSELLAAASWWKANYPHLVGAPVQHRVQRGDTLPALAEKYYGDANKAVLILRANGRAVGYGKGLSPGQTLLIPADSRSFTINLMNEWGGHGLSARDYATAYNAAIGTIRGFYNRPLIVDVPGWAQETAIAASAVKGYETGGVRLNDGNIILSVHVYPSAYVHQKTGSSKARSGWLTPADLDDLASAGRPCMVGEFGSEGGGQADWAGLVRFAKAKDWPLLAWAWNGDGENMNMVQPAWQPTSANPPSFSISSYFKTVYSLL